MFATLELHYELGGGGKENKELTISKRITTVQIEDIRICTENYQIMWVRREGVRANNKGG
jgi:hypothetical protein